MFRVECMDLHGVIHKADFKDVEQAITFAEETWKRGWLSSKVVDEYGNTIVEYEN